MKMTLKLSATLLAVAVLAFGCKTNGDDGSSTPTIQTVDTPTVLAASELPSIGEATVPATDDEKVALFTDSCSAIGQAISNGLSSAQSLKAKRSARQTYEDSDSIDTTLTVGSGSIAVKGSYWISETEPEKDLQWTANTTYNDLINVMMNMTLNGTITNITTTYGEHSYTINGVTKNQISEFANVDVITGKTQDSYTANVDFALGLGIGTAISVVRDDGAGAKFVITFGTNYAKNDINVNSMESAIGDELRTYLASKTATLTVYNNYNTPVLTKTLTAQEAFSASILSEM